MTREQIKRLKKILEETVEFPDGTITFRKHYKSENGSTIGWYAIT